MKIITSTFVRLVVVMAILATLAAPAALPVKAGPVSGAITIGGLLGFGKVISDLIHSAIATAGAQVASSLSQLEGKINGMIAEIEKTYKDSLHLTLDQVKNVTNSTLQEFANLLQDAEVLVRGIVDTVDTRITAQLDAITVRIEALRGSFEKSMENVIVMAGTAVTYIVDRTFHNVLIVVAWAMIGIFGIVFVGVLIRTGGLPRGFWGVVAAVVSLGFVGIFGAIGVSADARAFVMKAPNNGSLIQELALLPQEPYIARVEPPFVTTGPDGTKELSLIGIDLRPGEDPMASIGSEIVPVIAVDNEHVVLDLRQLPTPTTTSVNVSLSYPTLSKQIVKVVQFIAPLQPITPTPPPDLSASLTLSPASPIEGQQLIATVQITNVGPSTAENVNVELKLEGETGPVDSFPAGTISAGQTFTIARAGRYSRVGSFDPLVIVDPYNQIVESNESNNIYSFTVSVSPRPDVVIERFFRLSPSLDPGNNVTYAPSNAVYDDCLSGLPFDTSKYISCVQSGNLSQTSLEIRPGDRIVIETNYCEWNEWYVPLKPNCIAGGFARPGIWGPAGVSWYNVYAPEFPFTGKLFQLGMRFGSEPAIPVGTLIDTRYTGAHPTTLTLYINDTNLADNEGEWTGTIKIVR